MTSTRELSHMIATVKARHRAALNADLTKLRTKYGTPAVAEAMRLLEQNELRTALSASADRHRRHAARLADGAAQALFARKAHDE
jgi:hypothetical protein